MSGLNKYVELSPYAAEWAVERSSPYVEINYFKRISGWGRSVHQHEWDYQFFLVTSGKVVLEIGGDQYTLGAGDASIISPKVPHRIYTTMGYEQVGANLSTADGNDDTGLLQLLKTHVDATMFIHSPMLLPKADELVKRLRIDGRFAVTGACLLVKQIVLEALEGQILGETKRFDAELSQYLADHLADKLTLRMIADHFHISISQLERNAQKFFGAGAIAVYNQKRFKHAFGLIRQTELSMKEIAQSIGFDDVSNFSAFVSKYSGTSPSRIRKNIQWVHNE